MTEFPEMFELELEFPRPVVEDPGERIQRLFSEWDDLQDLRGRKLAVAAGSRGIANLDRIVKATLDALRDRGAEPFVVPAMGSHGGATGKGQAAVLAGYGITPERVGAPVVSSMDTVLVGETPEGVPVAVDRAAFESDGIILVNRIKPHTDFKGEVESGLMKMIAVGLGNREGADSFHSWTLRHSYELLIESKAKVLLDTGKVLAGVAIVENAYHETAWIDLLPAGSIPARERELLVLAKELMPSLPVGQLDVLIVDRIGKDISGVGMDPNVTGRWFRLSSIWQDEPRVTRIVVLGLTKASYGNAVGLGLADFCSQRAVDQMDAYVTALNAVTSRNTSPGKIPLVFSTDREALTQAMKSLDNSTTPENVRVMRIRDTLSLGRIQASPGLREELGANPRVRRMNAPRPMEFDSSGRLLEMAPGD